MNSYLGFFREMIIEPILTRNALPSFIQAYENNDSNLMKELFYSVSIQRSTNRLKLILSFFSYRRRIVIRWPFFYFTSRMLLIEVMQIE